MRTTIIKKLATLGTLCFGLLFAANATAQNTHMDHAATTTADQHVHYTCPMHPEVITEAPGKCPKCGMDLVKMDAPMAKTYSCPMHPDITSDKPGKCPTCGMAMVEKYKRQIQRYKDAIPKVQTLGARSQIHRCNFLQRNCQIVSTSKTGV